MANFWKIVDDVIAQADILLLVVDARMIEETRNVEVIRKVKAAGKTLITVINKADLVEKDILEQYKKVFFPCVFVSAQKYYGMTKLRHMILRFSDDTVVVGVLGYPNTGKSSVINALKGKGSASVSSQSGHTKGIQKIKVDRKITVLDTPGVLADTDDKSSQELILTASKKTNDPELTVYTLLNQQKELVLSYYHITTDETDAELLLELIAKKLNRYKSGGILDTETTARIVLQDWQKGKL